MLTPTCLTELRGARGAEGTGENEDPTQRPWGTGGGSSSTATTVPTSSASYSPANAWKEPWGGGESWPKLGCFTLRPCGCQEPTGASQHGLTRACSPGERMLLRLWAGLTPWRVGSWAGLYISVAPARKSRSESPSEAKKSLTVPRHNAGGSPWPVVDAGLRGDSSRPSPPSDDRAGDIVKSSIPEKPSQPVWRRSWRSLSHTTLFWLKESTLQTGIAPENGAREEETGK